MKDLLKLFVSAMLVALLVVVAVPAVIAVSAYIGYFFGIIVMWLAHGILTDIGIAERTIPSVMAWLFVLGSIISTINLATRSDEQ